MVSTAVGSGSVWVFVATGADLPCAVFTSREIAEDWIKANRVAGLLTEYPLDQSAYDWAVAKGYFKPTRPEHRTPKFIARFTSASQEHGHYDSPDGSWEQQ